MSTDCKKAYILIDQNDLEDFRNSYGVTIDDNSLWLPIGFVSMMQVVLAEHDGAYYAPKVINENKESVVTKEIYEESQKFLKQAFLGNNIVDNAEDSFPQEYFWTGIWIAINRVLSFCNDFLNRYSAEEVVLIKRDKYVTRGGLLINLASFTRLIERFFESRNIKVKIFEHQKYYKKPKTIFYEQPQNPKMLLLHLAKFVRWKLLSFNNRNYDHILINPSYDNVINCYKTFKSSGQKVAPQVFYSDRMPFLHSWWKSECFFVAKFLFNHRHSNDDEFSINSYKIDLCDFEFDFADIFRETIVQYLSDAKWMKSYIDLFWQKCLEKGKKYLTIFSLSPAHLHSYFLIKKTKDNGGKVAVWQHGGVYGYVDFFQHYITDYKHTDYFLSFGKNNAEKIEGFYKNNSIECVQVGSNVMYAQPMPKRFKARKPAVSKGLFMPVVVGTFYSQNCIKWRGDLQFEAMRQIIDYFDSGLGGNVVTKGLRSHKPHYELQKYIESKKSKYLSFADISINKALSDNPKFVVLDNQSTPLLQTLVQYKGPIFLMVNQESWSTRKDALSLLKRRVVYSESIDELKMQLTAFFKDGDLNGADTHDTSFVDEYLKRFCYSDYERFVQEAI